MTYLKRFGYFIITGLLVSLTVSFIVNILAHFFKFDLGAGGYTGLFVLCLIWGLVGSFVSLQISRWSAKKFHGVHVIDPNTTVAAERKLVDTVYRIARHAGLEVMPEVGFYESPEVNAFATGPSKKRSLVAVSSGLVNTMTDAELEGVLAHEIAHITNGDMVTLTLIQGIVTAFAMFLAQLITMAIMNAFRKSDDDRRGMGDFFLRQMIYSMVSVVFTLLGSIVVNYFSRAREFRADAGGARYASPEKMTAALARLQTVYALPPAPAEGEDKPSTTLNALKISGKTGRFGRLFMTHPPLEERIAALKNRTYASSL
jgi:heat shock protein HtpX